MINDKHAGYEITEVFWSLPLLTELLDLNKLNRYWSSKHHGKPAPSNLSRGYGFCIVSLLWSLADAIIQFPRVLDIKDAELLVRAWQGNVPFHRMPTKTQAGQLVRKIVDLYRPLMGADTFADIEQNAPILLQALVKPLSQIFLSSFGLSSEFKKKTRLDVLEALKAGAIFKLLFELQNRKSIKIAYNYTYDKGKRFFVQSTVLPLTVSNQRFFDGYKLGIVYLWESLLEANQDSIRKIKRCRTWDQLETLRNVTSTTITQPFAERIGLESPTDEIDFKKRRKIPDELMTPLIRSQHTVPLQPASTQEILDEAFLWYPLVIAGTDATAISSVGFATALLGTAKLRRGPIHVLKFIHRQTEGNTFSFAILIHAASNVADYSYWWVFPDFATDFSGMGGAGYAFVTQQINGLEERIILDEIPVAGEEFHRYVKRSKEQRLEDEISVLRQALDAGSGAILELVYATIAQARGDLVRWRYKNPAILGDREIDVLSIGNNATPATIEIAECTRTASKDDVSRLKEKLELCRHNSAELLRSINGGNSAKVVEVRGRLVCAVPSRSKFRGISTISQKELREACTKYGLNWYEIQRLLGLPSEPAKYRRPSPDDMLRTLMQEDFDKVK
ncbi:MAG: hypothetical protein ABSF09_12290 [Candidatus Bathyarchaeia archaeon]|jgi:hypothetical protein